MTVRTSCPSCCKAGRIIIIIIRAFVRRTMSASELNLRRRQTVQTAQTVLLINVIHECLKLVFFFLSTRRAVCCRMIDLKKGLELALNY